MRDFLSLFTESAKEFTKVRSLVTTSLLVAVSMVIEMFSVDIGFAKLNFAFLAIAIIGMLFGPCMGLMAGFACDIVGCLAHPSGGFLPAYVLVGGLQGLVYGLFLYHKVKGHSIQFVNNKTEKSTDITLYLRAILARLTDVIVINLLIQTKLNLHYGFISPGGLWCCNRCESGEKRDRAGNRPAAAVHFATGGAESISAHFLPFGSAENRKLNQALK